MLDQNAHRLTAGDKAPVRSFVTIRGATVVLEGNGLPTHIQFRRFAGCPVCSLHLRSFLRRKAELEASVREVVIFHSSKEELLLHAGDIPFDIVADPGKAIYRAFGVEAGKRALLDRRAWPAIARSLMHSLPGVISGGRPVPPLFPVGGRYGLPADFLVRPDGRIAACKFGRHADDQWSVDDVMELAARV